MKSKLFTSAFLIFTFSTLIFKTASAQMFWNQAASFAGNSGSYISVPNSNSINITGSFSIEAWINPASVSGASKGILSKGGLLGTSLRIGLRLNAGRPAIMTNGAQRLISKTSTVLAINKWTHCTATYNSSTGLFKIFINGLLDTSATIAGAAPTSTDSLFIGITGSSTPFAGQLDEVRFWNRGLSDTEVLQFYRTSMAEISGVYNGLVLSMTFQDENSLGADFNSRDISGNGNNGNARNVTAIDQSNNPYVTIHNNESVFLNGSNSYLSAKDTSTLDALTAITLECWVYPTSSSACTYISKGTSAPAYFLGWNGAKVIAKINNINIISSFVNIVVPLNQWTHLAFVYKNTGSYNLYLNGKAQFAGFNPLGNIDGTADSLFIGGGSGVLTEMSGYIDDVRITKDHSKSEFEILSSINNSVDAANDPDAGLTNISYNLDGLLVDNANNGGPKLRFIGGAKFSHPTTNGAPVSPVTRDENNSFSKGYYVNRSSKPIPLTGSSGVTLDTILINQNVLISDLNLFVGINHQITSQLDIVLIGPNGDSVKVFNHSSANTADQGLVTLFDDQADSSLSDSRFTTFSPVFKPANSLNSVFSGDESQGKWILKITDDNPGETGILYAWGFQLNNQIETKLNLNIGAIMQGFYHPVSNLMIRDTMRIYIRERETPYTILDSSIAFLDGSGLGLFSAKASLHNSGIHIQLKHRNSIETWTQENGIFVNRFTMNYNFFALQSRAFGDNQILVDNSPELFGIYSGDVNQDGTVDLSDLALIDNNAANFASGYLLTDLTGDDFTDLADYALADNNAANFVSAIHP